MPSENNDIIINVVHLQMYFCINFIWPDNRLASYNRLLLVNRLLLLFISRVHLCLNVECLKPINYNVRLTSYLQLWPYTGNIILGKPFVEILRSQMSSATR